MKFDEQKAFPYPVLRPNSDDYIESEFQATVDIEISDSSLVTVNIAFAISSDDVEARILEGKAQYVAIVSCRQTYYRETLVSQEPCIRRSFDSGLFKGEVRVQPYVAAVEDIFFSSADINPEFGAGPFLYEKGHLLAIDEPQVFYIDRDLFKSVTSVFDLVVSENLQDAEWLVSFEQDQVEIAVSSMMKQVLDNARNDKANQVVLINSLYFAVAMQCVQLLREEGGEYDHYRWAKVFLQQCHNKNIDIRSHLAYKIAEKLMNHPLRLLQTYVFKGEVD